MQKYRILCAAFLRPVAVLQRHHFFILYHFQCWTGSNAFLRPGQEVGDQVDQYILNLRPRSERCQVLWWKKNVAAEGVAELIVSNLRRTWFALETGRLSDRVNEVMGMSWQVDVHTSIPMTHENKTRSHQDYSFHKSRRTEWKILACRRSHHQTGPLVCTQKKLAKEKPNMPMRDSWLYKYKLSQRWSFNRICCFLLDKPARRNIKIDHNVNKWGRNRERESNGKGKSRMLKTERGIRGLSATTDMFYSIYLLLARYFNIGKKNIYNMKKYFVEADA